MAGPRRQDPIEIPIVKPGLYTGRTRRGAKGRWRRGDNVRWYGDPVPMPQKMGGCIEQQVTNDADEVVIYMGHARSCLQWDSLDSQNWIAFGTECKLYLLNNDRLYDITPLRKTQTIVDGVATTNGSTVITITAVGHDAQDGDHAVFKEFATVGDRDINGEHELTVVDIDTIQITLATAATATVAAGGGTGVIDFEISCGLTTDGTLDGYGTGDYDEGTYGTPREDSTFGGHARVWSLDKFGEDLLASPNGGTLYHWDRTAGPNSRAQVVPGAPLNIEHMLVGPDEGHVIALGTNLLNEAADDVTGQQDKMFLRWCVSDNFEGSASWVPTEENDAGSKRLDIGSRIITAVKGRNAILLFTDEALYVVSLVGGNDVYDVSPMGRAVKIISKMAAIDVNGIVYIMGQNNFYIFDGTLRPIDCEIFELVFKRINRDCASKVHCRYDENYDEVRWAFTTTDSEENDAQAILHRPTMTWTYSSMPRESSLDNNGYYGVPVGFGDRTIFLEETGTDYMDEPLVAFVESWEGEVANGADVVLVTHLLPDFEELVGSVDVQLFGHDVPEDAIEDDEDPNTGTVSRLMNVTRSTGQITPRYRNRHIGIRVESNDIGDHWRMDTWRMVPGMHGRRS